jgi:hypothetical protein
MTEKTAFASTGRLAMLHLHRNSALVCVSSIVVACSAMAAEPQFGQLKMRFVFGGNPPKPREIRIDKDEAVCAKDGRAFDDSLMVNEQNGGLANVVVWMAVEKGQRLPEEHADHIAAAKKEVKLDAAKCRFVPHVSLLRTHQKLRMGNSDPVSHNSRVNIIVNERPFGAAIPTGPSHVEVFTVPEKAPVSVACSIHPWMSGWVLIQEHPYMAVSNSDGKLQISHVPVGKWKFIAWHERVGWLTRVAKEDRPVEWPKGRFDMEVKPQGIDLGTIKLAPEVFKK